MASRRSPNWPLCGLCFSRAAIDTRDDEFGREDMEPVKAPYKSDGEGCRQQAVFLVMAPASTDGPSSRGADSSDSAVLAGSDTSDVPEEDVWFDCDEEEWLDVPEPCSSWQSSVPAPLGSQLSTTAALPADQLSCLQALPPRLSGLLTKYLQGPSSGCKHTVGLLQYLQDSKLSVDQLQTLLQPLLDSEKTLPQQLPTPTPRMSPDALTAALARQRTSQQQTAQHGSTHTTSSSGGNPDQQQHHPRVTRLLRDVRLTREVLSVMDRQEGFKQVAHGPLELWYCHDTSAHVQMIRARTVLEEPLSVVATVTREVDLVRSWNPSMEEVRELGSFSPTELLVYMLIWMPWPLPLPEVITQWFGVDLLDLQDRCVLLHISSTELPPNIEAPKHSRTLPLHMNVGGFKLVPLPPLPEAPHTPRTEVTVLVGIDAARFTMPDSAVSWLLKVFAPLVHKNVLKVLQRMFHQAGNAGGTAGNSSSGKDAPSAAPPARSAPSATACSSSALLERLRLRPEYAAMDAHAARVLAAEAPAGVGAAHLLDLTSPRTTAGGGNE